MEKTKISSALNNVVSSLSSSANYNDEEFVIIIKKRKQQQPPENQTMEENPRPTTRKLLINCRDSEQIKRRRWGVFLGLNLTIEENLWRVKKKLTGSDVNDPCRLLLLTPVVEAHIFPLMDSARVENCKAENGVKFAVFDADTNSEHEIIMKRWTTANGFVLLDSWKKDFVVRRNLAADDLIGLFYHPPSSSFYFSVLKRASAAAAAAAAVY